MRNVSEISLNPSADPFFLPIATANQAGPGPHCPPPLISPGQAHTRASAVFCYEFDSCRLKGGTNRLKRFGFEAIALFQTSNRLRGNLRCFGQFTHSPAKRRPRHPALDRMYFITG